MTQRVLLIQLARLGDLVQTIPAVTALKACHAAWMVDLLCPDALESLGRLVPGVSTVMKWDGPGWRRRAMSAEAELRFEQVAEADAALCAMSQESYDRAFVLNQHPRAILAGALLAKQVTGACRGNPLDGTLSSWGTYVRGVASARGTNRIHLADAFCGMCGVHPPRGSVLLPMPSVSLPIDLEAIGKSDGPWIGLVVGAGDRERVVPESVWMRLIGACLDALPRGRVVLLGSQLEHERAHSILAALPSSLQGRVWDATGRVGLMELTVLLARCHRVVGTDTGPLHLAAAVGTQVIGWYFARARVHETGPYGLQHWVWQAEGPDGLDTGMVRPTRWPIEETVALLSDRVSGSTPDWSLWKSYRDRWGAYYVEAGQDPIAPMQREQIWQDLHLVAA